MMIKQQHDDIAFLACALFSDLVDPKPLSFMSEELGECFHLSVELLADSLTEKWRPAIEELAKAVLQRGPRTFFERLDQPPGVEFSSGTSLPRLIMQYVPPAETDDGRIVPGYRVARFDVRGVSYR